MLNKDIGAIIRGFIRMGQPVRVKLDAFPFTDFGLIDGTLTRISRDAIPDDKLGLVYNAQVTLDCAYPRATSGAPDAPIHTRRQRQAMSLCGRIAAKNAKGGMAVQAEIKTGTRQIIQYLLNPIMKATDEARRER